MYTIDDLFESRSVVGTILENIIATYNYTKKSFSEKTGISRPTLNKLLSGNISNMSTYKKHITKILNALNATPDTLLGKVPNRHNRINSIRDLLKINESDIVSSTGISLARLKELEAGSNANISELRDIAANLFTDTKSILGANYFQPQTAIMVDYIESNEDQSYSECGFWGHIGILLSHCTDYLWFPITLKTRQSIYESMNNKFILVQCMNNKLLLLNMCNIQNILLLDDDLDQPSFTNWDQNVDCGNIPFVAYEALDDYIDYKLDPDLSVSNIKSENFINFMDSLFDTETENNDYSNLYDIANGIKLHYKNGHILETIIDCDNSPNLLSTIMSVYEFSELELEEKTIAFETDDTIEMIVNLDHISAIELPMAKIEDAICSTLVEHIRE